MKIRLICTLCCILGHALAYAQVMGTVIDGKSGAGLSGVEVVEINSGKIAITETNGFFTLDVANDTTMAFYLYMKGYKILQPEINDISDHYVFKMTALQVDLSEVEIIRKKQEIFATKKLEDIDGTSIYAGKKTEVVVMDLIEGNKAANVGRQMYAQISGLNIYEGSDGGLQLNIGGRGLDPNRTSNFNTRQNGYDISADVLGYPENYYTPPADALEEIRIVRGASSLQYGTQFGGLIDFRINKIPAFKKWSVKSKQTVGSYKFYDSFNAIGYNHGKFTIDAYYNYKEGDGYRDNSQYSANNAFLAGRLFLSDRTRLSFEFTYYNYLAKQAGGLTDLQFKDNPRLSTRDRNWFNVDWRVYNIKFNHNFTNDKQLEISVFGLDAERSAVGFRGNPAALNQNPILAIDEKDADGNYVNPRDLIIGSFRNIGTEIRYLNHYGLKQSKGIFLIGAKYYNSFNRSVQGPGSKGSGPDFSLQTQSYPDYPNQSDFDFPNRNWALFSENIFYLSDRLTITPGLRYEYIKTESMGTFNEVIFDLAGNPISNNVFEESKSFPRQFIIAGVGADYKFAEDLKLSVNISQNYRSVTFSDIRVVNPSFIIDENISDENGFTFNTTLEGKLRSRLSYDMTLYSILYNDRIGIVLDDRANRVRTNIGDAIIVGTESLLNYIPVLIVKDYERIFRIKTFLNSAFTYSSYLNSLSNNVVGNRVEFIPRINIKTGLSLDYKSFNFAFQYSYISEQFTDAQNSQALQTNDFRSGLIGHIPSYHILDISLSQKWNQITVYTGINNLTDNKYFTRRATGYPGPGIIPSEGISFYVTLEYNLSK